MKRKLTICLFSILLLSFQLAAQRSEILTPHIHTLQLITEGDIKRPPVIDLGKGEKLTVSFDDMTHEYRRYVYRIQHCSYDWQPTEDLFESDYLESAAEEEVIENYSQSLNTSVLYTHYSFTLPNSRVRPILSGNYKVTIYEDGEDELRPVAVACFSVVEEMAGIAPSMTTNTDIDFNRAHQQLSMEVKLGDIPIRDAREEIHAVVTQNQRWDHAVIDPAPTSVTGSSMIWDHHKSLIFEAGNEFRKFEMLSTRYPGMHMENIRWYPPYYHATLMTDAPRPNYLYDEDGNGLSVIRKEGSGDPETEADYAFVHFNLACDSLADTDIHVCGQWNGYSLSPEHRMRYNNDTQEYETDIFLKQGYYNYLYLAVNGKNPQKGQTGPIEGNFFQTENNYSIYIYYRRTGDRYDRLVGFANRTYRP